MQLAAEIPAPAVEDKRHKILDAAMKRHQYSPDSLLEALHTAQGLFGYLDEKILLRVGRALRVPPSRVYGVATFYNFFALKPPGRHTCVVCMGTACYVKGAAEILKALEAEHGVRAGGTTPDGALSLLTARCVGACGIAPAVIFDGQVAGHVRPESALERTKEWSSADVL